jgi:putative acetyltransferase
MHIRFERPEDAPRIHDLHRAAFGSALEGDIVDALRTADVALISLVAVDDAEIVGHILFSPVTLTGADDMQIGSDATSKTPGIG